MIRYTLACNNGHRFESWFQSGSAFDALKAGGHLACPVCDSAQVDKSLMVPAVASTKSPAPQDRSDQPRPVATAGAELEARLRALRAHVEATSDYVGTDFVSEARRMHQGEAPERPIYGEARSDEARALIEDGVPVLPLPFTPKRHRN